MYNDASETSYFTDWFYAGMSYLLLLCLLVGGVGTQFKESES